MAARNGRGGYPGAGGIEVGALQRDVGVMRGHGRLVELDAPQREAGRVAGM